MSQPQVSIVIPMYNEEDNVGPLCDAVRDALVDWDRTWELVLVEDGSSDDTLPRLRAQAAEDSRIRVLALKHNSGQTLAMATGFQHARGEVIVGMDGDLQNDPRDIPKVVERLDDGYDVVTGWRRDRKDAFVSRTLPSKIANFLIANLTGVHIHDNGCSLKAYRASIMKAVKLYSDMHRFLPALSTMAGARIDEVVVRHHARLHGESKYGISRTFKVLADMFTIKMITQFANRPGRWFALLSIPWFLLGTGTAAWWLVRSLQIGFTSSIVLQTAALLFLYLAGNLIMLMIVSETLLHHSDRKFLRQLSQVLSTGETVDEALERFEQEKARRKG